MKKLTLLLISSSFLLSKNLSFQGFTGLINTPNAQVIDEGKAIVHFNNQFDNNLRDYNSSKKIRYEENYIFGIGLLPSLEIVGRLVEARGYARDLSANVKYKIPLSYRYLPNIAIGIQDIGGSNNFFDNKYIVLDKEIGFFRASIGYGKSGDVLRGKRMDGVFGGVEAKVTDWLSLMAENDTEESHAGVKLSIPKSLVSSFNIEATVARNLTTNENSLGFNLILPLNKKRKEVEHSQPKTQSGYRTINNYNNNRNRLENGKFSQVDLEDKQGSLIELQKKLVNFGFENVRIGEYGDKVVYVECENSIFDKNELDALGYIIGTIVNSGLNYNYYTVTLLKNRLQTVSVNGSLISFRRYINNPSIENSYKLKGNLVINREFDTSKVKFKTKRENSSFFRPRVELSLGLVTPVGTELGVFDYLASLRTNLYMPLYKGLIASAMYESPFANSNDFDKGGVYYKMYNERVESRLVNANIHQTTHYKNLFNTLSVGKFDTDYYGILNQTNLASPDGEHAISLKVGSFTDENDKSYNVYEGSYRYFYEPLELFTTISYGEYWHEDSGVTFELKRFFNDTAISLIYQDLDNQYIGAKVSFPFTLRKIAKASPFGQIKGKSDFEYGIRSSVNLGNGSKNRLLPNGGKMVKSDFILENYYLNRDRLNPSYILGNIARMREAYLSYK